MPAYLITYDLNTPGQNYDKVIEKIKESSSAWCSYWKSSWLIKSNLTPNQITDKIKPFLDGSDRLIVIEVTNNYQGWMAEDEWTWIKKNIFS